MNMLLELNMCFLICDFHTICNFGNFRVSRCGTRVRVLGFDISRRLRKPINGKIVCNEMNVHAVRFVKNRHAIQCARCNVMRSREVSRSSHCRRRLRRRLRHRRCYSDCNRMHSSETPTLCMRSDRASSGSSTSQEYTME